ncbi:hypothetical protein [Streptomyces sp. CB02923]|uniref:hypothetical protein n=1 Tax=Streptomyces sp. CB02923 TaxID=1718985 RepID=UPI001900F078|nr:hypothetical protein [Streptomyces sp. CB02923]
MERPHVSVEQALKVVGLTREELLSLGGSVLTTGSAHLVGSLAGGLGNRGSDIDVHMLVPGITKPTPAYLFFAGNTPVDVEHYPDTMPGRLVDAARAFPVLELPFGTVSTGPAPGRRTRRTAARWLNSLPLHPDQPPVFDASEAAAVLPTVVRAGLDQLMGIWAVARLAERAEDADAARYLYRRAGRELLELRCRAAGDVLTSEKWLPDRAARLGLGATAVRRHYEVSDQAGLTELLDGTGLGDRDPWSYVTVRTDADRQTVRLGREKFALTRHGRLIGDAVSAEGSVHRAADSVGPRRLLDALRNAELVLETSDDALTEATDA